MVGVTDNYDDQITDPLTDQRYDNCSSENFRRSRPLKRKILGERFDGVFDGEVNALCGVEGREYARSEGCERLLRVTTTRRLFSTL